MTTQKIKTTDLDAGIFIASGRGLRLGLLNFWRNKILSLATIVVMGVILFIFNIILGVHLITNQGLQNLSEHLDLNVDLRNDIELYDAQNIAKSLEKLDEVKSVKYISKDEALETVNKTHPETVELYKKFNLKNPLPPSLSIKLKNPEAYEKVQNFLKQEYKNSLSQDETLNPLKDEDILSSVGKNLSNINNVVRQIIFWIVLAFVSGGTLVIINAIQLTIYTRRQEIHIMRLVGATPNFIRLPFIFEGILYSAGAVLLSFIFLLILSKTIQIEDYNLANYYNNFALGKVFAVELILTVILGIISSFSAVEQYLKGKLIVN